MEHHDHLGRRFEEDLEPIRADLLAYTRHLLWEKADLADVLQEILLTAYRRYGQFTPGTSFKAWVFQIATYEVFNWNRKHEREKRFLAEWAVERGDPVAEIEAEAAYEDLLRQPEALARLLQGELRSAIGKLPPNERSVVLLRIVGGFSTAESSQILGMPVGSVMGYLGRARRRLRLSLADFARESGLLHNRQGGTAR